MIEKLLALGAYAKPRVSIDFLWENSGIKDGSINAAGEEFDIAVPNIRNYNWVAVVHISDDSRIGVNIIPISLTGMWTPSIFAEEHGACYESLVGVYTDPSGMDVISFQANNEAGLRTYCIPVRIYGIKGITEEYHGELSTFQLNGRMCTYENGMTWIDYCESAYNLEKIDISYDNQHVYNILGEHIADGDGVLVSPLDTIFANHNYHSD